MIFIDHREMRSKIPIHLEKREIETKIVSNQITDYVIDRQCGVERKTVSDFLQSIANKRIYNQARTLKKYFSHSVILLEGGGLYTQKRSGMRRECIRGALLWLSVTAKIPIIRTYSDEDSAEFLALFAKSRPETKQYLGKFPPTQPRRSASLPNQQIAILTSMQGIGLSLAKDILRHFGSIAALSSASHEDICTVPRIGKQKAEQIRNVFHSRFRV